MPSIFSFLNKPSLSKNWIYSFRSSKDLKKSDEFLYYSKIRIYKDRNILQLMNQLMIANLCKSNFFVRNSLTFVTALQKVLGIFFIIFQKLLSLNYNIGKNIAKLLIKNTMGRVFTGGEDLLYMNKFSVKLMKDNGFSKFYQLSNKLKLFKKIFRLSIFIHMK